jgi:uncharacterized membrane protein YfcA
MEEITKSLVFAFLLLLILYLFGTLVYHNVEGWSWVDCIYFMTATFTTVGYGDLVPRSDAAKIFTVFFMWTGISIGFYMIYTISKYREEKLDHPFLSFIGRITDRGPHKPSKSIPTDMKRIVYPAYTGGSEPKKEGAPKRSPKVKYRTKR